MRASRRPLGVLALVGGGILVALIIAEATARVTWTPPGPPPAPAPTGLPVFTETIELMLPGVQGVYNGAFYRTNAAGFRGHQRPGVQEVNRRSSDAPRRDRRKARFPAL